MYIILTWSRPGKIKLNQIKKFKFSEKVKNFKNEKYIKSAKIIYNLTHKYEDTK